MLVTQARDAETGRDRLCSRKVEKRDFSQDSNASVTRRVGAAKKGTVFLSGSVSSTNAVIGLHRHFVS